MVSLGFNQSIVEPCVYFRHLSGDTVITVLYVDDLMFAGSTAELLQELKDELSKRVMK